MFIIRQNPFHYHFLYISNKLLLTLRFYFTTINTHIYKYSKHICTKLLNSFVFSLFFFSPTKYVNNRHKIYRRHFHIINKPHSYNLCSTVTGKACFFVCFRIDSKKKKNLYVFFHTHIEMSTVHSNTSTIIQTNDFNT